MRAVQVGLPEDAMVELQQEHMEEEGVDVGVFQEEGSDEELQYEEDNNDGDDDDDGDDNDGDDNGNDDDDDEEELPQPKPSKKQRGGAIANAQKDVVEPFRMWGDDSNSD
jgi:hypothetical protein